MKLGTERPALYVHVPFCASRCSYCHFYAETDLDGALYLDALERQHALLAPELPSAPLPSIFVGGGTPSYLPAAERKRLLALLACHVGPESEFSCECNPEDVNAELVAAFEEGGVTRLSLGVQSLAEAELAAVGRRHDASGARRAITLASKSSLDFSIDLMIGLPGQSRDSFSDTLAEAAAFEPDHISIYCLEGPDGDGAGASPVAGEELAASCYLSAHETLAEAGFVAYEVSNWCRPGGECRHNLSIWRGASYLGLGPAAHSFRDGRRWSWPADLAAWAAPLLAGRQAERLEDERGPESLALEHLLLGLRTREGIPLDDPLLAGRGTLIDDCGAKGWARVESGRWRLLPEGWLRLDGILARLSLDSPRDLP